MKGQIQNLVYTYEVLYLSLHRLVPNLCLPFLLLFPLSLLPNSFLFFVFPVSGNLLSGFPSQAVGETVTEL